MDRNSRTALIVGATGLIGGYCLQALLSDPCYREITALVRKPILTDYKKLKIITTEFRDGLATELSSLQVDDVYCCLGTTIKKAGSQKAFKEVDFSLVITLAELMKDQGAEQFLVISSMGADPKSRIFYNRVKGEMEEALRQLAYPCLRIIRPSLLLGQRKEFRPGEKLAILLTPLLRPLLVGSLKKYRPVEAEKVAGFMVKIARVEPISGIYEYDSDMIAI